MHFSKPPSNSSFTKLMIFVPLKTHTPWFVLGLVKVALSGVCWEAFFTKGLGTRVLNGSWQTLTSLLVAHRALCCHHLLAFPAFKLCHLSNRCGSHKDINESQMGYSRTSLRVPDVQSSQRSSIALGIENKLCCKKRNPRNITVTAIFCHEPFLLGLNQT